MRYTLILISLLILASFAGCGGGGGAPDRSAWFEGTWRITGITVAEDTDLAHDWRVGDLVWFTTDGIKDPGPDENTPSALGANAPADEIDEVLINTILGDTCLYHYKFVRDPLGRANDVRWEIKAAFNVIDESEMTGWIRTEQEHGYDPLDIDDVDVTLTKVSGEHIGSPLVFR